jgi:translation initiation factor IF-2
VPAGDRRHNAKAEDWMSSKTEKAAVTVPVGLRLHELAKEMGVKSTALMEKATELGIKVKSHASILTPGQCDRLRAKLGSLTKLKAGVEESKTRALSKKKAPAKGKKFVDTDGAQEDGADGSHAVADAEHSEEPAAEMVEAAPHAEPEVVEAVETPELPVTTAPVGHDSPPPLSAVATIEPAAPAQEKDAPVQTAPPEKLKFGVVSPPPPVVPAAPVHGPGGMRASLSATSTPTMPTHPSAVSAPQSSSALPPIGPPKRTLTTPEVAPPIQRNVKADPSRFGVVVPAPPEPEKPPVQAKSGGSSKLRPTQVEAKPADDFKPQVSYPVLPGGGGGREEEDRGGARSGGPGGGRGAPVRRGPGGRMGPGIKGFGSGPRRGVALLRGDDDRFRGARRHKRQMAPKPLIKREGAAEVTSPVSIKSLCEALGIKSGELVRKFLEQGKLVSLNSILSDEDAMLYALEFDPLKFGITIKKARDVEEEVLKKAEIPDKPEDIKPRAPVVTIMGHVDHGKTSLLDYIRNAKVAAGEAGGITQHIGAYKVNHTKGQVSFLDTPGHRAFTEMRARGANVTDVVVLVVSAVDGVMPQTEEAIAHAKQAGKKLVVALNKIDLPESNSGRVKGQLAAKELFVEGYGGEVGCVEVSAKTGQGVDELLDRILLEAEVLELKANPDKPAIGTVVEAHKDQGRGIVCTLLVQEGTLNQGDVIICGHAYGSVRQIFSDTLKPLDSAGPSTPVLVTGLNDVPLSGERFHVLDSIKHAAEIADQRAMRLRQEGLVKRTHVTLETFSDILKQGGIASLRLVLKVDVQGSLTPLRNAISELSTNEARIDILHDGVGAINETDVLLADASDAIVIGFSISADPGARRLAEERGVDIRTYNIIYNVVDEVRLALEGMLKPIEQEVIQGHATVRQTFKISKIGTIAGCFVTDGLLMRNSNIRLLRDAKPVWSGKLASLKRVKDDAKEVRNGFECGIKLDGFDDIKPGDIVEAYTTEQVKRTLEQK